jgi:hypothetical protein
LGLQNKVHRDEVRQQLVAIRESITALNSKFLAYKSKQDLLEVRLANFNGAILEVERLFESLELRVEAFLTSSRPQPARIPIPYRSAWAPPRSAACSGKGTLWPRPATIRLHPSQASAAAVTDPYTIG